MTRAEALAKVGKRVELHDLVDDDGTSWARYSQEMSAGTTGRVIHTNVAHRWIDHSGEYDPVDVYEVVIEWDLPDRRMSTLDKSTYGRFIMEME